MICVSIAEPDFVSYVEALPGFDFVELRLDKADLSDREIEKLFRRPVTMIATCRPGMLSNAKREHYLRRAVEAGARYVDLELEAPDAFRTGLMLVARRHACQVIISHHDDGRTPHRRELEYIVDRCFDLGADIAKIACFVRSRRDNARLLSLYDGERKVIALGLGALGQLTRVLAVPMGAPFSYASRARGKETAEGQLDRRTLAALMERLTNV